MSETRGLIFSLGLVLVFPNIFVQCECPDEWTSDGGSCYAMIDQHEDWVRANDVCKLFSGYLAEIASASESDFVKRFAKNKNVGDVWIGGNDLLSNGKWMWTSTGQRLAYTDWAPGEPSGSGARCIQLWSGRNYLWDNASCGDEKPFLCETSPNEETIVG